MNEIRRTIILKDINEKMMSNLSILDAPMNIDVVDMIITTFLDCEMADNCNFESILLTVLDLDTKDVNTYNLIDVILKALRPVVELLLHVDEIEQYMYNGDLTLKGISYADTNM